MPNRACILAVLVCGGAAAAQSGGGDKAVSLQAQTPAEVYR